MMLNKNQFEAQFETRVELDAETQKRLMPTNPEILDRLGVMCYRLLPKIIIRKKDGFYMHLDRLQIRC